MIEINHLVKKYGEHVAVDDLTLTVEPGKIYGFLGPNGAGKSTTMNMITGYLGATSGEVKINGSIEYVQYTERREPAGSFFKPCSRKYRTAASYSVRSA